jgi:phosphoribosylanthranilate isomerase
MATKVKICGIRTEAALDAALESGADYVGLVFYERSPRHVDLATAERLSRRTHERSATAVVALLVDPDDPTLDRICAAVRPDIIQLHGCETPERVAEIRRRTGLPVMKAVSVARREDVDGAVVYLRPGERADLILFDAKPGEDSQALPGGNGLAFDWKILAGAGGLLPFALAGGLTSDNVAEAIRLTAPAIVDVSSGVERAPGDKDPELIRRFLRAAKGAKEAGITSPRASIPSSGGGRE